MTSPASPAPQTTQSEPLTACTSDPTMKEASDFAEVCNGALDGARDTDAPSGHPCVFFTVEETWALVKVLGSISTLRTALTTAEAERDALRAVLSAHKYHFSPSSQFGDSSRWCRYCGVKWPNETVEHKPTCILASGEGAAEPQKNPLDV